MFVLDQPPIASNMISFEAFSTISSHIKVEYHIQRNTSDGGPSPTMTQGHQGSPKSPSLMSKVQEISQGEQGNYFVKTGISAVHKPGFVHVIT